MYPRGGFALGDLQWDTPCTVTRPLQTRVYIVLGGKTRKRWLLARMCLSSPSYVTAETEGLVVMGMRLHPCW